VPGRVIPRGILIGLGLNALAILGTVLLFFQTKDPTPMGLVLRLSFYAWVIALVIHILTRGFPVRIVADERKGL
jgi:hypothetical protein